MYLEDETDVLAMALVNAEMGGRFVSLSTVESDGGLAQVERKTGRAWEQLSGMGAAQVCLAPWVLGRYVLIKLGSK
jgi:hypothetical protein